MENFSSRDETYIRTSVYVAVKTFALVCVVLSVFEPLDVCLRPEFLAAEKD